MRSRGLQGSRDGFQLQALLHQATAFNNHHAVQAYNVAGFSPYQRQINYNKFHV